MYYLYFLKSKYYKKTYVGITNNLLRRIKEHNSGKHPYTKRYQPWKYIFVEKYLYRFQARKREIYLKSSAGRRWLKKYVFD